MTSQTPLKVIALVSGGKDSLFTILHCLANCHEVVALGNLHPDTSTSNDEDLNSFMYQTVGHTVIPLLAQVLDLPLYRQPIRGHAVDTNVTYSYAASTEPDALPSTSNNVDETESLTTLLCTIKAAHPEATAVCAGAILSTYQRTRVESVALRLALTPLAYLWQYPTLPSVADGSSPFPRSAQLLMDIAAVGMDARIVKVASGGMDEGFLWKNVVESGTMMKLASRMRRFGEIGNGALLGEGGEFETLTVDGPYGVWKGRIIVDDADVRTVSSEGGTAYALLQGARVEMKKDSGEDKAGWRSRLRRPPLWDPEFSLILPEITDLDVQLFDKPPLDRPVPTEPINLPPIAENNQACFLLTFDNLTNPHATTPSAQLNSILRSLSDLLATEYDLSTRAIVSSTLLLRSMASFALLNPVYGSYFAFPNPPARVTVACGDLLPENVDVALSVVVDRRVAPGLSRKVLHVQSYSYWAPANIGPYSQAVGTSLTSDRGLENGSHGERTPRLFFMAGQIPLDPASMGMLDFGRLRQLCGNGISETAEFAAQALLSLQHLWRVGRAVGVQWWSGAVALLSGCDEAESNRRAATVLEIWKRIHTRPQQSSSEDEDEDVDIWDIRNKVVQPTRSAERNSGDDRMALPDWSVVTTGADTSPPLVVAQVSELPRDASVEWTASGLSECRIAMAAPNIAVDGIQGHNTAIEATGVKILYRSVRDANALKGIWKSFSTDENQFAVQHHTVYLTTNNADQGLSDEVKAQVIPCRRVWDTNGERSIAVVVTRQLCPES